MSATAGPGPATRRRTRPSSTRRSTTRTAAGCDRPTARRRNSTVRPGNWAIITSAAAAAPEWPTAASVSARTRSATASQRAQDVHEHVVVAGHRPRCYADAPTTMQVAYPGVDYAPCIVKARDAPGHDPRHGRDRERRRRTGPDPHRAGRAGPRARPRRRARGAAPRRRRRRGRRPERPGGGRRVARRRARRAPARRLRRPARDARPHARGGGRARHAAVGEQRRGERRHEQRGRPLPPRVRGGDPRLRPRVDVPAAQQLHVEHAAVARPARAGRHRRARRSPASPSRSSTRATSPPSPPAR